MSKTTKQKTKNAMTTAKYTKPQPITAKTLSSSAKRQASWRGIHLPDQTFMRFKKLANTKKLTYARTLEVLLDSYKASTNKKKG